MYKIYCEEYEYDEENDDYYEEEETTFCRETAIYILGDYLEYGETIFSIQTNAPIEFVREVNKLCEMESVFTNLTDSMAKYTYTKSNQVNSAKISLACLLLTYDIYHKKGITVRNILDDYYDDDTDEYYPTIYTAMGLYILQNNIDFEFYYPNSGIATAVEPTLERAKKYKDIYLNFAKEYDISLGDMYISSFEINNFRDLIAKEKVDLFKSKRSYS